MYSLASSVSSRSTIAKYASTLAGHHRYDLRGCTGASLIVTSEKSSVRDREVVNWMSILDVNETDNSMKTTRLICCKKWENNCRCMYNISDLPDLSYGAAFVTSIASPRLTLQPALLPVAPL
jgi:hypothetical protein